MTELEILIDTPIGGLLFVSGTISIFVILAILIMKKGTETHNIMGYLYFFGLGFTNYAATMSYYEGLLPLATVIISVPISTLFLVIGLVSIMPKSKSSARIKWHIASMIIATCAFTFGLVSQLYHFKINALDAISGTGAKELLILTAPILLLGFLLVQHFYSIVPQLLWRYSSRESKVGDKTIEETPVALPTTIDVSSRQDSKIIYTEEQMEFESKRVQRGS